MAKKEYSTVMAQYQYFNARPLPKNSKGLMEKIIVSGEKVLGKNDGEYDRWVTLGKFQQLFDNVWDYENKDFIRFWLDQAVREVDVWIFNGIMVSLGRNNRKSETKAEEVCKQFRKLWI